MSIRKKWYIHIMQADTSKQLSWSISRHSVHIFLAIVLMGLLSLGIGVYRVWSKSAELSHLAQLKKENDLLRDKMSHFSTQMDSLLIKVQIMENWEDELRSEKKLKLVNPDVRALGSGGQPSYDPTFLLYDDFLDILYNENISKLGFVQSKVSLVYETHSDLLKSLQTRDFAYRTTPSIWPTYGNITSTFGSRIHPLFRRSIFHAGVDIANDRGTVVYATAEGIVSFAARSGESGLLIRIDHASGYQTRYAHLDRILVRQGDFVEKGQIIARMGNTGNSTGTHLHYEVADKTTRRCLNPFNFFDLSEEQIQLSRYIN